MRQHDWLVPEQRETIMAANDKKQDFDLRSQTITDNDDNTDRWRFVTAAPTSKATTTTTPYHHNALYRRGSHQQHMDNDGNTIHPQRVLWLDRSKQQITPGSKQRTHCTFSFIQSSRWYYRIRIRSSSTRTRTSNLQL